MRIHYRAGLIIGMMLIVVSSAKQPPLKAGVDTSLFLEAQHSAKLSLDWLQKNQHASGYWSSPENPALTALVLRSFLYADRAGIAVSTYDSVITRGFAFLKTCVRPDGGIYAKGYENYNTAISLLAFIAANRPEYREIIVKANNFLVGMQMDEGEKGKTDSLFDGGIGYNKDGHSDMNNTSWSLEAFYLLQKQQQPNEKKAEKGTMAIPEEMKNLNWKAAVEFISRCQNLAETNPQAWVSEDSVNKGGFVYYPGNTKADPASVNGKTVLPSYGTMSLSGIMALLFADLPRTDIRIQEAFNWLQRNYTLQENPGLGQQGLYFYYYIMAKALRIYRCDSLQLKAGTTVLWRKQLLERLVGLQKKEGYWVNDTGRWMENDPVLATSYALMAVEMAIP